MSDSRVNNLLNDILDDATEHDKPLSRVESILASIIDETEYTEVPQSSTEDLLIKVKAKIEEGGGGTGNPEKVYWMYNDVELPPIPTDGEIADHPYKFIRKLGNGAYDMACGKYPYYYASGFIKPTTDVKQMWWKLTDGEWEFYQYDTGGWSLSTTEVIWTNTDIPNGSASATDLYMKGSEPVQWGAYRIANPIKDFETFFKYNGVEFPQLPVDPDRPYYFIRKNFEYIEGAYDLIMGNKPFYRPSSGYEGVYGTSTINTKMYQFSVATDTEWTYVSSYSGTENWSFKPSSNKVLHWTSHDIHIGSVDGANIYFEHSEPEEWKRYKVN